MALIGLLNALDPSRVDVDLFIYSHQGPLMRFIPEWVNLLPEIKAYSMIERPMGDDISIVQFIGDSVTPWLPKINPSVEYDLCISFLIPHNIGRDKVKANKRLAWIHTDYSTVSINVEKELTVWNAYNKIAAISPEVKRSFLEIFPSLSDKMIDIENILPADFILSRAEEFDVIY